MISAVAATIAALFQPVPALADPAAAPADTFQLAVPDIGARPTALGGLTLPGQKAPTSPITSLPGAATNPALQQIEKGRNDIATLGDKLIQAEQDRELAKNQAEAARLKYETASANLQQAQSAAADAAAQAVIDAAAMPPGSVGGLGGLSDLARLQRGDGTAQAIARQIELAQITTQLALDERELSIEHQKTFAASYKTLQTQLTQKQTAQQRLEAAHAPELAAAEASQAGVDSAMGAGYLAGPEAGRGADAKAIGALQFALAQRGDPYVWSEEGPDEYDCSGLMWAAYRSVGFQLNRVSRDQYWQTRNKVVSRYSLLPGDLLFFSHSNSWRGIHHVAMYAGDGMMVEAPRTGLNVRLVPVRWSRLFQATRVFGSIEGVVPGPVLGAPDAEPPTTPDNPTPTTLPTTPPTGTRPPTTPTTPPTGTTPPGGPSTTPTTPSTNPTTPSTNPTTPSTTPTTPSTSPTTPSTSPTTPSTSPTTPSTSPTTKPPTTTNPPDPTTPATTNPPATTAPSTGGGSNPGSSNPGSGSTSGGASSGGGPSSDGGSSSGSSSAASTPTGGSSSTKSSPTGGSSSTKASPTGGSSSTKASSTKATESSSASSSPKSSSGS